MWKGVKMDRISTDFILKFAKTIELLTKIKATRPSGWLFRIYFKARIIQTAFSDPAMYLIAKKVLRDL